MRVVFILLLLICATSCKHSNTGGKSENVKEIPQNENPEENNSLQTEDILSMNELKSFDNNHTDDRSIQLNINYDLQCNKCDLQIIRRTQEQLEILDGQMIYDFLCTFDKTCSVNVEFSEFGNDILYKVLSKYPYEVVQIIDNDKNINSEYLYKELGSPLLDYNYNSILRSVGGIEGYDKVRDRIIEALNKAIKG